MWRPAAENRTRASGAARALLTVSNDFAAVEEAIESMLKDSIAGRIDAFSDRPFRRASLMPALFERLGVPPLDWCCLDTSGMPPPALETLNPTVECRCGTCGAVLMRVDESKASPLMILCLSCGSYNLTDA